MADLLFTDEWNEDRVSKKGVCVSAVYNPEADIIAEIERLELEAKDMSRSLLRVRNPEDVRVLNRQLNELKEEIAILQARVP